jgi:hypothetical protein
VAKNPLNSLPVAIMVGSAEGPIMAAETVDVFAAVGEVAKAPEDSAI